MLGSFVSNEERLTDISHESLCSLLVSFLLIFTLSAALSQWTTFSRESNTGTCKLINFYSPDKATAVCVVYECACVHGPKKNKSEYKFGSGEDMKHFNLYYEDK